MLGLLIKELDAQLVKANTLDDYYRLLEVDTIDIVTRKINGKYYDIVCDDEALLKESPIPRVLDKEQKPMIFGNVIIAGVADSEGNMTDLSNEDIFQIMKNLGTIVLTDGRRYTCLLDVEY